VLKREAGQSTLNLECRLNGKDLMRKEEKPFSIGFKS
jgi:hypothetical protein